MASQPMQRDEHRQQALVLADSVDYAAVLEQIEARRVKLLEQAQRVTKLFQVDREMRLADERARQSRGGTSKFTFAPLFPKHTPLPREGARTQTNLSITWQLCRGTRKMGPERGMRVRAVKHVKGLVNNLYRPELLLCHALPCEIDLVWATELQFAEIRAQWKPDAYAAWHIKCARATRPKVAGWLAAVIDKAQPIVREQFQAKGLISPAP